MARPKLPVELSSAQRLALTRVVKAPATPQKMVRRARLVLLAANGCDNDEIARQLETSAVTVGLWRQRFLDEGMAGLEELARSGRKAFIPANKLAAIVSRVVQPPPGTKRLPAAT